MKSRALYTTLLTAAAIALPLSTAGATAVDAGMPVHTTHGTTVTDSLNVPSDADLTADVKTEAQADAEAAAVTAAESDTAIETSTVVETGAGVATDAQVGVTVDAETETTTETDTSAAGTTATETTTDGTVSSTTETTETTTTTTETTTSIDAGAAAGATADETATEAGADETVGTTAVESEAATGADAAIDSSVDAATETTTTIEGVKAPADALPGDVPAVTDEQSATETDSFGGDAAVTGATDVTLTGTSAPAEALAEADYAASHTVADVKNMDVIGANGKKLGSVEEIVTGEDSQTYGVVKSKGIMGLGRKQVLVPLNVMTVDTADGQVVLSGTSSLNGYTKFKKTEYTSVSENNPLNTLGLQFDAGAGAQVETR